jgi:Tol biopolymer transport system component
MVAFVLQSTDLDEDRFQQDIYVVPVAGGPQQQLTTGGTDKSPRWSPDSKTLAFVSNRSGKAQLWLIDTAGGEAWRLITDQAVACDARRKPRASVRG